MKVAAVSGSLREGSYNSALLRAASDVAPDDITIEISDLADIPLYNADVQENGFPEPVSALAETLRGADGLLIATPEYNYSVPGVLKNAIDWVSRVDDQPFDGLPIAIMGASMGNLGTARSQYHLRQVFVFLNGLVMNRPEVFVGAAHEKFDENGDLMDRDTREFLARYLAAVREWIAGVGRMLD